jgi:hypothetical protein
MSSAVLHDTHRASDAGGDATTDTAPDVPQLLQRLQTFQLRADLDARNIAQLRQQNKELEDALKTERGASEKHAEALMRIARTCDNRVDEMKAQHAAAMILKDTTIAKLEDAAITLQARHAADMKVKDITIAKLEGAAAAMDARLEEMKAENAALKAANAALEAQVALLSAQTTAQLTDIRNGVAALQVLLPSLPPPPLLSLASLTFDCNWCSGACGTTWKVAFDAAKGVRAHVTHPGRGHLTLRSAAPLPRRPTLSAYRVVIETYSRSDSCYLGFVPSHHHHQARAGAAAAAAVAAVTPSEGRHISEYGGWAVSVHAASAGAPTRGWTVMQPSSRGAAGDALGTSDFATTTKVPPVAPGGAVEFAVDYAAGTCRLSFYTPEAVAGGFAEMPHAKMELRFVATADPARSVPTLADSGVELYPVVLTSTAGAIYRFA